MYNIREAREDDREQSIQLLVKTFGDMGILEDSWVHSWKEYMNRPEQDDWNYVATVNDKVVANLAFFGTLYLSKSLVKTPKSFISGVAKKGDS